jgi:uncharacterized SAM-binding protein YcdF (DUF218 family)
LNLKIAHGIQLVPTVEFDQRGLFFWGMFLRFFCVFVFQAGFVAFVASVAFVGVWLLWVYHALPI